MEYFHLPDCSTWCYKRFRGTRILIHGLPVETVPPFQPGDNVAKTKTLAKLTASERKEQQKLAEDRQARQEAAAWVEAHHPDDVVSFAWLAKLGDKKPWKDIEHEWPDLIASLLAKGRAYAVSFIDEVKARYLWIEQAWTYATYAEGVTDGRRWASTIAPADQLDRLRTALRYSGRRILVDTEFKDAELSAAHSLLFWVLGHDHYPSSEARSDDDGWDAEDRSDEDEWDAEDGSDEDEWKFDSHCEEFKTFWQPFFPDPLDEVLESMELEGTNAKCKLMEPNYILGFIDGATGLSEQLRTDHLV